MNSFKDIGIAPPTPAVIGDKIEMRDVLDTEVTVKTYRIVPSKYTDKGNGKCLHLQIVFDNRDRVVFTGSGVLMETLDLIPKDKFPFTTKIIKRNKRYEFT